MGYSLTARDFWLLILKLPHDERVRLAKLGLRAANGSSAATFAAAPAGDEFPSDDEPLAREGQGWTEPGVRQEAVG